MAAPEVDLDGEEGDDMEEDDEGDMSEDEMEEEDDEEGGLDALGECPTPLPRQRHTELRGTLRGTRTEGGDEKVPIF